MTVRDGWIRLKTPCPHCGAVGIDMSVDHQPKLAMCVCMWCSSIWGDLDIFIADKVSKELELNAIQNTVWIDWVELESNGLQDELKELVNLVRYNTLNDAWEKIELLMKERGYSTLSRIEIYSVLNALTKGLKN